MWNIFWTAARITVGLSDDNKIYKTKTSLHMRWRFKKIKEKVMETQKVIEYFRTLSSIPRASGDEKKAADYIMDFAKERGLEAVRDGMDNIVVKKPATLPQCKRTVILQGHLDMVYVKSEESVHRYEEGIELLEDEEFYFAKDTSLGADNGIAAAYCLALLDSDTIMHPNLEVIFTAQEEVGLAGAANMDISELVGDMLINLDSEEEGFIYTSCAGGLRCRLFWEEKYTAAGEGYQGLRVSFHELRGGHSGMNISSGRGNAIVLLGRLLYELKDMEVRIGQIDFSGKANAIPSAGSICLYVKEEKRVDTVARLREMESIFKAELRHSDEFSMQIEEFEADNLQVYERELQTNITNTLMLLPNGVAAYSQAMEGLVETSMNLGSLSVSGGNIELLAMIRSSVASGKYFLKNKLEIVAEQYCDSYSFENDYPGWEYRRDSKLRETAVEVYEELFGKRPEIAAIHAGLECGYWADKKPGLDIISIGPDLYEVHSVEEKVSKQSIANVWEFFAALLKKLTVTD